MCPKIGNPDLTHTPIEGNNFLSPEKCVKSGFTVLFFGVMGSQRELHVRAVSRVFSLRRRFSDVDCRVFCQVALSDCERSDSRKSILFQATRAFQGA